MSKSDKEFAEFRLVIRIIIKFCICDIISRPFIYYFKNLQFKSITVYGIIKQKECNSKINISPT
jgi:hypothetical protein